MSQMHVQIENITGGNKVKQSHQSLFSLVFTTNTGYYMLATRFVSAVLFYTANTQSTFLLYIACMALTILTMISLFLLYCKENDATYRTTDNFNLLTYEVLFAVTAVLSYIFMETNDVASESIQLSIKDYVSALICPIFTIVIWYGASNIFQGNSGGKAQYDPLCNLIVLATFFGLMVFNKYMVYFPYMTMGKFLLLVIGIAVGLWCWNELCITCRTDMGDIDVIDFLVQIFGLFILAYFVPGFIFSKIDVVEAKYA